MQGVVATMCSVLPAAMVIKVKSRDQAHRRATIKGSRWRSGHKYDQNQNKMPDVVYTLHSLLTLMLHRAIRVISTVLYNLLFVQVQMICVDVSCNLVYNFTTNVHSNIVCSGMQNSKIFCMWEMVQ